MLNENLKVIPVLMKGDSLNPCFNGICSMRSESEKEDRIRYVLILVLMEYAQ